MLPGAHHASLNSEEVKEASRKVTSCLQEYLSQTVAVSLNFMLCDMYTHTNTHTFSQGLPFNLDNYILLARSYHLPSSLSSPCTKRPRNDAEIAGEENSIASNTNSVLHCQEYEILQEVGDNVFEAWELLICGYDLSSNSELYMKVHIHVVPIMMNFDSLCLHKTCH